MFFFLRDICVGCGFLKRSSSLYTISFLDEAEKQVLHEHCSRLRECLCRWPDCEVVLNTPGALLRHLDVEHGPRRVNAEVSFPTVNLILHWRNLMTVSISQCGHVCGQDAVIQLFQETTIDSISKSTRCSRFGALTEVRIHIVDLLIAAQTLLTASFLK